MSRKRGGRNDDHSDFESAMKDVQPLAGRDVVTPPPKSAARPAGAAGDPAEFDIERTGERIEGRAAGINRAQLRKLRAGRIPIDVRIDLHGMRADEARDAVRELLVNASEVGERCALVIHGRGHGSQGGPVLKEALPGWLAEPPLGARVIAFVSATQGDGGAGATYVLLRRLVRKPG